MGHKAKMPGHVPMMGVEPQANMRAFTPLSLIIILNIIVRNGYAFLDGNGNAPMEGLWLNPNPILCHIIFGS